jgi:general secretion pathway protein E
MIETQIKVEDARILTVRGGEYQIGDELREILCYMEDGRLFVSKTHISNAHVRGFIGRLQRLGKPCNVLPVDLSTVAKAYADSQSGFMPYSMLTQHDRREEPRFDKSSDMQRAAKALFVRAVDLRASDIHLRISKREKTKIFFRVHNDLEFVEEHPYDFGDQLCSAIYQAMADVSDSTFEPLSRQDARIADRSKLPAKLDGIRVATSPSVDGYLMVLRLLYSDTTANDLSGLGYNEQQREAITFMKRRPTGIVVIGGPTGSGKSTTLQLVLSSVIRESAGRKNIITVEDPPEYPIPGAVQTPVTNADTEDERSKSFQKAIKAAMRLDPDVIMIGEVRDTPSAKLAIQAAMTGHQVWTTVHANSAFAIIDRLVDLRVPMELVSDPTIVTGLSCQRLLKVLCPNCKKPISVAKDRYTEKDMRRIAKVLEIGSVYMRGDGCDQCRLSGTIGRTAVAEVVVTDEHLMALIRKHDRVGAIQYWRKEQSGISMLDHAIEKINQGIVDPLQAEDVIGLLNMGIIESDLHIDPKEIHDVV